MDTRQHAWFVRGQCLSTWMDFKRDRLRSAERNRTRLVKVRGGRRRYFHSSWLCVRARFEISLSGRPIQRSRALQPTQRARILSLRGYSSGVPSRLSQLVKSNNNNNGWMECDGRSYPVCVCICIYIYTQVKRFQTLSRLKCFKFPIHRGFIFGIRFLNYLLLLSELTFTVWVLSLSHAALLLSQTLLSLSLSLPISH